MYLAEGEINVLPDMVEFNGIKVEDNPELKELQLGLFITTTFRYSL